IEGTFDLVFIDANKRHYLDYYHKVLPRVAPGGFIIADNTIWYEKVTDESAKRDAQTEGIIAFNNYIAADERVEKVIVPVRDGLTIIYKKP
ncbi:MAG: methyltransferase, partial [Muribaculaceae bacterium]|nr:methyltransferase [Muribaculaceae bacterium]